MGWRALKGKAPFNDVPPPPITIANDARLVVVGDWGSGLQRARNVATQMKRVLDAGTAERKEQWVIHLGDVYYAGSTWEYQNRFLPYWPTLVDGGIESFTLNGNHDMFTGGHAYYATCLADPRFRRQEHCSFFQLSNDHWELFALDTSYEDGGLYGGQAQWLLDNLDKEAKKTMLFSHHQLFSGYEPGARTLQQKIKPVLDTGRVDAWFWGHEHRCLVYGEDRGVRFASCVGHGGIPEYLIAKEGDPYPPPLVYDYRKVHGDGWQPWDTFGFAVIDLTDTGFHARYVDEDGNEHKRTQFP
jgi:predicted phosphodiesterase